MSYFSYLDYEEVREYHALAEQSAIILTDYSHEQLSRLVDLLPNTFKKGNTTPLHAIVLFYRYVGKTAFELVMVQSLKATDVEFHDLVTNLTKTNNGTPSLSKCSSKVIIN